MLNQETRRRIDAARDILVGKVPDPKAQVEQITTALIYKFMDDMDQESLELGGDASFFTQGYEKYAWKKLLDTRLGGLQRLSLYVEALEKMPQNPLLPELFRNLLKDAFLPYRDPETLNLFLKEINGFTYDHSEKLGDAFEYLLSIMSSQGDAGQFRTPRHIIDFIVEVLDPKKGETILDPACGTAGFLISSYKHILKQNTNEIAGDLLTPDDKAQLMNNFVGYDISPDMVRLSLVNMYLHSFPNPNAHEYDALTSEERWDETYDIIMANPPFMTPKGGIRPHRRFAIQANRSEVLFVDYIAEHLNNVGRAGIIVPEGIIFQSGRAYKALRKMLVEKYLYAVVSLPPGIFQPYSGVKTSILLMDKNLAKALDSVLFVKIQNDGFDLGAQRRPTGKSDLPQALSILQQYTQALRENADTQSISNVEKEAGLAIVVSKAKVAKSGDCNLSGERYRENKTHTNTKWPIVKLGELFETKSGTTPSTSNSKYYENGNIYWVKTKDLNNSCIYSTEEKITELALKETHCEVLPIDTVLIAMYGGFNQIGRTGILKIQAATNQAITALLPNPMVNPHFLNQILILSKDKWKLVANSTRKDPNISRKDVLEFEIPLPPLEVQQEIVAELERYQKIIDGAKQVVENYKPAIKIDSSWQTVKLGEICEFRNGINYTKESQGEKFKILGVKDFQDNFYAPLGEMDYIVADSSIAEKDLLKENDIVFVRSNGNPNLIGRCMLIGEISERITHSGFTIRLILKSKELNPVFLTHILKLDAFRKMMVDGGTGANIKSLNQGTLSNLVVPLPYPEMQNQIIYQLKKEQKLVDANKQLIEIFEQKIKDKIAEVWQTEEEAPTIAYEEIETNNDIVKETSEKIEVRQAELFSLL